jgi:hypothetical protein
MSGIMMMVGGSGGLQAGTPYLTDIYSTDTLQLGESQIYFMPDGTVYYNDSGGVPNTTVTGQWLTNSPTPVPHAGDSYEIMFTYLSGAYAGNYKTGSLVRYGTYNTWLSLAYSQYLSTVASAGTLSAQVGYILSRADIRRAGGDGTILATATMHVYADASNFLA